MDMTMWQPDDHAIDRVIDDAARDLTAGGPTPALRARVMERIDAPRASFRWMWLAVPAAAAAIAIGVFAVHDRQTPRADVRAVQTSTAAATRSAAPAPVPSAATVPAAASAAARAEPAPHAGRGAPAVPHPVSEVEALAPARLGVAPIDVAGIEPPSSIRIAGLGGVDPITIESLEADVEPPIHPEGDRR
jgi:hypothetical protein